MARLLILRTLAILLFVVTVHSRSVEKFAQDAPDFRRELQLSPEFFVEWEVFLEDKIIAFTVRVNAIGWIGFGLSNSAVSKRPSDAVIGGVRNGQSYFKDYHFASSILPFEDNSQDWFHTDASEKDGITTLSFWRKFETEDLIYDVDIKDEDLYITWAFHSTEDILDRISLDNKHTTTDREIVRVNLLQKPELPSTTEPPATVPPTTEPPTTEPPTTEPPTTEPPTTEPPTTEPPTTEPPTTEPPTKEPPTTEPPTTEPPTTGPATTEPPTTEPPTTGPPTTEPPTTEPPTTEPPTTEPPTTAPPTSEPPPRYFRGEKDLSPEFNVVWEVFPDESRIAFTVRVKAIGWIGFGISNSDTKVFSDVILGGVKDGLPYFDDYHFAFSNIPNKDDLQDWTLTQANEKDGNTTLAFWRKFDSGDELEDIIIKDEDLYMLWAYHPSEDTISILNKHLPTERGTFRVNLLQDPERNIFNFHRRNEGQGGADETT
ncbi:unnamed protein product [Allacma fusca]|uniref:DOMON domain-containing protein n=1 Tax=Allacma fusca TaxID=39272 RepID=A0A8J2PIS1_9HEXA|nr:unnamed protein product [Allacma fusca]